LGLVYIDTGAMYRALTLKATRLGLNLEDEGSLTRLAETTKIDLKAAAGTLKVTLDDEDVSVLIRTQELTNNVKYIARVPGVRKCMVKIQRDLGARRGAVLEGRDIGTVVFPDADFKFYLDADLEERAKRRHKDLVEIGQDLGIQDVRKDVVTRDSSDMKRSVGALKKAPDAIFIDTTNLTVDEVVEKALVYINS
jgi:cytidylate kinase